MTTKRETLRQSIINPWWNPRNPVSRQFYEVIGKPCGEYRGVRVYHLFSSWLYVLGDTAISERAGFSKECMPEIVDSILDGSAWNSDAVISHLQKHGYSPKVAA